MTRWNERSVHTGDRFACLGSDSKRLTSGQCIRSRVGLYRVGVDVAHPDSKATKRETETEAGQLSVSEHLSMVQRLYPPNNS